ncbi:MAG: TonB-dependent receptor [Betaproteobacteria bacterium]|nr:TonB-dependent receptor [Betaproteobacteria bacterium]
MTILLLAAVPALAQTDATKKEPPKPLPKTDKVQKVEEVEVKASSAVDERREDTATKIVVTAEEINKFGDTQVLDVMKRLPGVTVTNNQIRMRGLGAGYTQILIDGERPPPGFTLEQLSPTLIERIEIIRAATAEFSTQSIAGTVNIVLKKKVSFSQKELRGNYASGSFFKFMGSNFVIADKVGDLGYTINGWGGRNTNTYPFMTTEQGFDAAGTRIMNRATESFSDGSGSHAGLSPRLNLSLKGGDSLNWQAVVNGWRGDGVNTFRYVLAEGIPVPSFSSAGRYRYEGSFARTEANWIKKVGDGGKLDTKFSVQYNRNENENFNDGFNAQNQQNVARYNLTDGSEKGWTFTGKLSLPLGDGHSFVTGWDVGKNVRDENNIQRDTAFAGVLPAIPAFNSAADYEATLEKSAAFVQDEWNVTKNWSLYLGLRWEGLTTKSTGSNFDAVKSRYEVWSPILQTLYRLSNRKGEQLRLALTRTYKAPGTQQLIPRRFTVIDNTPTTPDFSGNPDLQPELATGIDAAYEKFWDKGASMSFAVSARRINDYMRQGLRFINNRWVQLPVNDGHADTKSIEFDAKFPLQLFMPGAPPIDARFNMNKNWSSVDSIPGPNNRLDSQTPFSATLGLDYRMHGGMITAGGSLTYKQGGEVRTSTNQSRFITAKKDMDVYVLWKALPKLQLRLTLSNVLTPSEINRSAYFDTNGRTLRTTETPSKMNVRAGVEWKF